MREEEGIDGTLEDDKTRTQRDDHSSDEIKAEVEETTKRHLNAFSEDDELMKDEELNTDDDIDKHCSGERVRLTLQ